MIKRFRGALVGFAVGDALGMPVEGLRYSEIRERYGLVRDFMPSPYGDLKEGEWTDDTEQMLILARSILKTVYFNPEDFANRLKDLDNLRLGPTSRVAIENLRNGIPWNSAGVESDTCGSAMRVMPIGLVYSFDFGLVERYALFSSVVTHRGPSMAGAVAVALGYACVLNDMEKDEIANAVCGRVKKFDEVLADKIAMAYLISDKDPEVAVDVIGNSISVYESVPFAFYCFFSSKDFEECALKAVNFGGDADTVAAMACGMMGCLRGIDDIPERWRSVKDYDMLIGLADRLHDLHLMLSDIRTGFRML